jgi:hypothetical protein
MSYIPVEGGDTEMYGVGLGCRIYRVIYIIIVCYTIAYNLPLGYNRRYIPSVSVIIIIIFSPTTLLITFILQSSTTNIIQPSPVHAPNTSFKNLLRTVERSDIVEVEAEVLTALNEAIYEAIYDNIYDMPNIDKDL